MKFVDRLSSKLESEATAFGWFIKEYSKHPDGVFAFFEGSTDIAVLPDLYTIPIRFLLLESNDDHAHLDLS